MKDKFNKNMNIKDLFTENEYNELPDKIKIIYDEKKQYIIYILILKIGILFI